MTTHSPRLSATLARLHAAIIGNPSTDPAPAIIAVRPTEPPRPAVRLSNPTPAPVAPLRPACEPLSTVTDLDQLRPGPRRLLELLHSVAVSTVTTRAYPVAPSQATIHQPQELMARALGCSLKSVYNWTGVLIAAGLVAARAHFTSSRGSTRVDGTCYAVTLKAGHVAHLAHDDLAHEYRDLDGDRAAGRTAWRMFTGSEQRERGEWLQVLQAWAVTPGSADNLPLLSDPVNRPATLQDAAHALPLVATAHPDKRPALVGMIASTIARALSDQHSRRFWCGAIWDAWSAEVEGRAGLQVLAAQLARLDADRREWPTLRKPAALLVSRLRTH